MFELALESPSLLAEHGEGGEAETLASPETPLALGSVLGGRYRIRALLGRGGMGEVWRAFDLKLRVDVALKTLLHEWHEDDRALATLRQEVRSAREVVSPHVCRVFDLIEIDGRELVSMEYIDGITLWTVLKARAPLDLVEAREIALQFLAGIEAIHEADLVHRDVKPENIMVTRSGRVVVMDFGIAKGLAEGRTGTISGTPAYMAPEQARGEPVTSRADVFSAGVILAEMVAPGGLKTPEARRRLWQGIRRRPAEIPDSPWAPVIERAVAESGGERYASASALARALEEVTLRVAGAEDVRPYPGLASFTEENAEYFFGRELEVEEMWKKLQRPHLLGLIGPSGAGKSSFLRAGLLPVMPTGWSGVVTTPGTQPFRALAQALIPDLSGDTEAMREMLQFEDPDVATSIVGRWRKRHDEALLIVDQFEELFTQNPPEVEERFAELLGRLALEADVHVLVAMRDDFLFRCHPHEPLRPLLSELTLLGPPTGAALRRALVQPALKCGYRFDDETLVEEMVSEITAERGALPLLAFAAARLWDNRDREQGLLTREAYEHVGGVGGALAQHAEATLETIGHEHLPIVRELFRNLVTAQGTRAAREQGELLSVFDGVEREAGERVLATLVDARLLTTYEEPADDEADAPGKRLEIIHESLLSNWPRLVRWRTQDADGAQLRDQLRQVARLWTERGRPEDLLWTGTSFKEYELWRERYAGGLSEGEEEFAGAMSARAARRRRKRQLAVAAAFGVLLLVLGIVGFFWRQSDVARVRAEQEARRAEASKLLALAQVELDVDSTAALAYVTASLELADTPEGRFFALRALSEGPPARVLQTEAGQDPVEMLIASFSPDGAWMSMFGHRKVRVVGRDGADLSLVGTFPSIAGYLDARFSPEGDALLAIDKGGELRIWSMPGFELTRKRQIPVAEESWLAELWPTASGFLALSLETVEPFPGAGTWPVITPVSADGEPGQMIRLVGMSGAFDIDRTARWIAYPPQADPTSLVMRSLRDSEARPRLVGRHEAEITWIVFHPDGRRIAAFDRSGAMRVWPIESKDSKPLRVLGGLLGSQGHNRFDSAWEQLASGRPVAEGYRVQLWDLSAPVEAIPLSWSSPGPIEEPWVPALTPDGQWLTTNHGAGRALWPLTRPRPIVLPIPGDGVSLDMDVAFTSDGGRLVSTGGGEVREWDLSPRGRSRALASASSDTVLTQRLPSLALRRLAIDPEGRFVVASAGRNVVVVPLDDRPLRILGDSQQTWAVALDAEGSRVATASWMGAPEVKAIRIFDLASGEMRTLGPVEGAVDGATGRQSDFEFLPGERLVSVGDGGLRLWDIESGTSKVLAPSAIDSRLTVFGGGRWAAYTIEAGELALTDLDNGTTRILASHGSPVSAVAVDSTGTVIVSGSDDGTVRVGTITGEKPHLLLGHEGMVRSVAISPDGSRIASISHDHTIRLWPMPDLSEPPLHTLPNEVLLAKLHSLTNVRVVRDEDRSTGWKVGFAPFPGWEELPAW